MSDLTIDVAKAVVDKAIEIGAWEWPDPNAVTDGEVMAKADEIIKVITASAATGSVNEGVLDVLHIAGIPPQHEQTRAAYVQRFGEPAANGSAAPTSEDVSAMARASAAPLTEPQSSASSEPAHSLAPAAEEIEAIFPGYDDLKVADIKKAVIASAASGDLSPEEWEKIKVYEAAHEERKTILSLQPEFKAPEPDPVPIADGAGAFGSGTASAVAFTAAGSGAPPEQASDGGDGIGAFYNGETISRAQQEGLPIPPQTTGEGVVMPIDITSTSDQQLSQLATIYHSNFARTEWLISQEHNRERAAEHLEHEAHRDAFVRAYELHKSEIPSEKVTATALDNARKQAERDADNAQAVAIWRQRKVRHAMDTNELKALARGYDKSVWRITEELNRRSRLATTKPA